MPEFTEKAAAYIEAHAAHKQKPTQDSHEHVVATRAAYLAERRAERERAGVGVVDESAPPLPGNAAAIIRDACEAREERYRAQASRITTLEAELAAERAKPKALAIADHVEAAQAVRNLAMLQAERDHPLIAAHDAALSRLREVLG